jgi:hypothetical protein
MSDYPQSEKLAAARDARLAIAEFIEWLEHDQGIVLATTPEHGNYYVAVFEPADTIIMRFLDIDEKALEQERRAMLEALGGEL